VALKKTPIARDDPAAKAIRLTTTTEVTPIFKVRSLNRKHGLVAAFVMLCCLSCWAVRETALSPHQAHWLHEEVNYLITSDERDVFLHLNTEQDRDKFIERFWQIRNPDPNAPTNTARETHYQRLEYANAHFGFGNVRSGWSSDRGMAYITLGAPQQIDRYLETQELKPIQIWFYQNLSGALPVHFYLLFYKQSPAEDWELYSPYGDRPQKLVNSTNAINDDKTAIKLIQRDINDEAAHIALSLIPGEPVDLKSPYPSLQSDVLLNNIRNYRNLPQIRELVAAEREASEGVSHRVLLGEQFSDLVVMATRDPGKTTSIRYLLRLLHPGDFSLTEQSADRYYYSLQLETKLSRMDGQVLSTTTQSLSDYLSRKAFSQIQGKCLGVEGRIEIAPGQYQLSLTLTNLATRQAFRQSRAVVVAGAEGRLGISQLFFADSLPPERSVSAGDPFSFSGVRLRPIGSDNASVTQGQSLRAIFQIWEAPGSPAALRGKEIEIHYLVGKLDAQARVEEDQKVDRGSFTQDGNLLMGKDLRTDTLAPGFYRLVVKLTDPETSATAYQSLNFEVRDPSQPVASLWTLDVPEVAR
jgi:GWxTD domain-containing protein